MGDYRKMSLESLYGLLDRVNDAIEEVADNIRDPNTKAKAKRRVQVTIDFKPSEDRENIAVTASVATKLENEAPIMQPSYLVVGRGGVFRFLTHSPHQEDLFDEDREDDEKVTPIAKKIQEQ